MARQCTTPTRLAFLGVEQVLSGKTYLGRAFVVDAWYITAYGPLTDSDGAVVGMLFVGVRQDRLEGLKKAIESIAVGKSGYVWVLGAHGPQRGMYIVSQAGRRDGESVFDVKDADGDLVIQRLLQAGLGTADGGIAHARYRWLNPGEVEPRVKIAAITYFEPWDWVIGAGAYEDDFNATMTAASEGLNRTLDALTAPMMTAAQTVERIAKGDVPAPIDAEYRGDFTRSRTT